ncbi:MAG TPA: L-type lectin-domain containing protein, partial [Chitinophagales bacterium]|nr:L-type lectin-domain containing protein [Chitinophagales bacterium]
AQCNFFLPDAANFNRTGQSSVSNYTYTLADQFFSSGAAWYRDSADLTHDFDISFSTYQCGTADGMVFVLQSCTNGLNALGDNGWGMGYYGNTAVFTNSLGVELDIYNNGPDFQDTNNSHIVITRDGQNVPVADPVYISPALGSCGTRTLQLTWNATSHLFSVYVDDTLRTSYTADLVNDVFAGNPHVYFGFTGSGSADFATQQFTVNYLHYQPSHVHTQTATINSTSQCAGGTLSVSPGASAYLWSTGDTTNIISNASPGTYSITVTDHGGCTQSAQYTVDTAPGDPAIFGDHIWNIYAWNAGNSSGTAGAWSDNYTGYYTEPNLTFSTWDRWPTYSSPSDASGYQGCAVSPDNHSYSAKRKAFTCGIYQVDIYAHSQAAELFINGSKVWEHDGANDSHINVWTGFLDNNSTVEYRVSAGEGYSYAGIQIISVTDLITLNGPATICPGYNLQLTAVTTNPPYLWSTGDTTKSISVNATGTYSVSIATGSCPVSDSVSITVQPIPTPTIQVNGQNPAYSCNPWFGLSVANFSNSHTYHWSDGSTTSANGAFYTVNLGDYTVVATDVLGCKSDTSLTVTLSTIPPPGDPAVFGDHVWNQYVWKSTNWSDNYSGYDVFSQDYPDAILYQNLSKWSASPSNSQTYQGCSPGEDNFSWNAKRRGFPSNIYQIDINHHDDDAELYVNGTLVWSEAGAAYDNVNVWTGCLGENSTVELRVKEFSGIQRADMRMTPKITIITPNGPPAICPGFTDDGEIYEMIK